MNDMIPTYIEKAGKAHRKRKKQPESYVKDACIKYLHLQGWHTQVNYNGYQGATPGRPDLQALKKGVTIYIETKAGKNGLSPSQKDYCAEILGYGAIVIVVKSLEEFMKDLDTIQERLWPGQNSKRLC